MGSTTSASRICSPLRDRLRHTAASPNQPKRKPRPRRRTDKGSSSPSASLRAYNFTSNVISVIQLGTVAYSEGLRIQKKLVDLRKAGEIGDVLLLLEHSPVITLGRNAKAANVLASTETLAARWVEVFECDRGGDVTFHGPGQLVGYPIFDLRGFDSSQLSALSSQFKPSDSTAQKGQPQRKTLGAVDYLRQLEEVLIRTCGDFGITAKRLAGLTGVWTTSENSDASVGSASVDSAQVGTGALAHPSGTEPSPHPSSDAKIAALGVHISRSVTSHGFALNVNTDLSYFNLIVPCGIASKAVTSMQKELGREIDLDAIAHSISRNFGTVFGRQMLWVETLDALLGHTVGVPVKVSEDVRRLHGDDTLFLA
jgi:lipoyl(octanoyl) transferase